MKLWPIFQQLAGELANNSWGGNVADSAVVRGSIEKEAGCAGFVRVVGRRFVLKLDVRHR
ncbi:MAG TPA: hypothetical protein VGQ99_03750 [Tepidisphaeraceae bacterium]|nr:hypothetical protein [Tepidisphaeraceae bacterium]